MVLSPGTRLGPYEITAQIGVGGMGEVYRATDTNLKRSIAIKVLPHAVASDGDRLARFQREAEVLASLNHPNIAAIYGLEKRDGTTALIMELVEGPTLADRIARGPLPVDDALPVAKQIADALEAAHEQGIIHRDLKPANIKLRPDGTVKVLDFGLAKVTERVGSSVDLSQSPTITSPAMTAAGIILGTAAYLSPEQAKGRAADRRSDLWAFGCVLFEMLTGARAFMGDDISDTLAAVLRGEPTWTALPADTPLSIQKLLRRCLAKNHKQRLDSAAVARLEIQDALDSPPAEASKVSAEHTPERQTIVRRRRYARWAIAALTISVVTTAAALWASRWTPDTPPLRLSIPLPANANPGFIALSPDGRRIVTLVPDEAAPLQLSQLAVRALDGSNFVLLPGTEGARDPFWSPDGRFIGFFDVASSRLKVVPAGGGPTQVLCNEVPFGLGGTWNSDGLILFVAGTGQLRRVSFRDGAAGACDDVARDQHDRWRWAEPEFLPDGRHFFYFGGQRPEGASVGVYLATVDSPVGQKVLNERSSVVYAPNSTPGTGPGHLLFLRGTTLMAYAFDERRLQLVGEPFAVGEHASRTFNLDRVGASAAADGTLVYIANRTQQTQLAWMDRAGNKLGTVGSTAVQSGVSLSPDGHSVAFVRQETGMPKSHCGSAICGATRRTASLHRTPRAARRCGRATRGASSFAPPWPAATACTKSREWRVRRTVVQAALRSQRAFRLVTRWKIRHLHRRRAQSASGHLVCRTARRHVPRAGEVPRKRCVGEPGAAVVGCAVACLRFE